MCRNNSGRWAVYVVLLSSCLVRRVGVAHNHALPCLLHCSTFVNVPSLLFHIYSTGTLDSKLLHASFSPACKLPVVNGKLWDTRHGFIILGGYQKSCYDACFLNCREQGH